MHRGQWPSAPYFVGCAYGLDRLRLSGYFHVDFGIGREADEFSSRHARWKVAFDRLPYSLNVANRGAALSSKAVLLYREPDACLANDDAVQVALLFDIDHVTRVHVFSNERAVENCKFRNVDAPRAIAECGGSAI